MEGFAAIDAGDVVTAEKAGVVLEVSADVVTVQLDEGGTQEYFLRKFDRSNQGTSYNQRVVVCGRRARRGRRGHRRRTRRRRTASSRSARTSSSRS